MSFKHPRQFFRWARHAAGLACVFAVAFWLGSHIPTRAEETAAPNYMGHVEPIIQANCLGCHNGTAKMGGLVLESYDSMMMGGAHGPVVVPGKSGESRIILMLEGKIKPQMPLTGALPPSDIAVIKAWIDAGALPPKIGAPAAPAPKSNIPDIKPQVPVVSPVSALAFSPDGKLLAVGGYKEVRLIEAKSGRMLSTLSGHADSVRALAFSPDGTKLVAAGGLPARSGEIKIWDVNSHEALTTVTGHKDCVYSVAVSPDGNLIATSSYEKLIKLWEMASGKELRTLKDHIDAVFAVTFSPDGKRLASGAADRTVKIWDVASGQRLFTLSEPLDGITTVAFSPSGKQLAAAGADKMIRLWDLTDKSGTLAQSTIAHEDTVLQVVYAPDGKWIISSAADKTIKVWDAATLAPVKVLEKQSDWAEALTVSRDGKRLAAGRYDGTVSVYDLENYQQVLGPVLAFDVFGAKPSGEKTLATR